MLEAFSTPRNRKRTFFLLAICVLLAFAAAAVGIEDNLPGVLLAFLSMAAFTVAFVHIWRASKNFRRLMYASVLGFIASGLLHNVLHGVASEVGASGIVHDLLVGAGVAFFLVAILLCPPVFLVGAVGTIVMSRREHHS